MPPESLRTSEQSPTFRQRVFGNRLWIGLAAVGVAALIVRPRALFGEYHAIGVTSSVALIVLGLALRTWAGGCAGDHTRDATIAAPRLVTGGPFAYVRNPIYLASVVLGLGMVLLIGDPSLFALYLAVFAFLYGAIVPAEEEFLRSKFGPAYERYCAHVPRAWPGGEPGGCRARDGLSPRAAPYLGSAARAEPRGDLCRCGSLPGRDDDSDERQCTMFSYAIRPFSARRFAVQLGAVFNDRYPSRAAPLAAPLYRLDKSARKCAKISGRNSGRGISTRNSSSFFASGAESRPPAALPYLGVIDQVLNTCSGETIAEKVRFPPRLDGQGISALSGAVSNPRRSLAGAPREKAVSSLFIRRTSRLARMSNLRRVNQRENDSLRISRTFTRRRGKIM